MPKTSKIRKRQKTSSRLVKQATLLLTLVGHKLHDEGKSVPEIIKELPGCTTDFVRYWGKKYSDANFKSGR